MQGEFVQVSHITLGDSVCQQAKVTLGAALNYALEIGDNWM